MKLKSLIADKPKYQVLGIASGSASPLKCLMESIKAETAVTRERPGFKPEGEAKKGGELVGDVADENTAAPGAEIEASFKPYFVMVDGDATKRPIDAIVSGLADINQSLILATNPSQAPIANANLQVQVESLRRLGQRLPPPFSAMLLTASSDFDGDLTNGVRAQLRRALGDQVTGVCQQIIGNRYPFVKTDRDVALGDFGKLFGAGGILDRFFSGNLTQYVDLSKHDWSWRMDTPVGKALSNSTGTLRDFQRAAQIRETFFGNGGTMPSLTLSITPPQLAVATAAAATPTSLFGGAAPAATSSVSVKMDANGAPVVSAQGPASPVVVQWPGANTGHSAVIVSGDNGQPAATIERSGAWSLFRLVEAGGPVLRGDQVQVSYLVGGRELNYRIASGSAQNPFNLGLLRDFHCPAGL